MNSDTVNVGQVWRWCSNMFGHDIDIDYLVLCIKNMVEFNDRNCVHLHFVYGLDLSHGDFNRMMCLGSTFDLLNGYANDFDLGLYGVWKRIA